MKCTRVPVPPQDLHSERLTPDFNPFTEHVLQVVNGVIVIVLLVPLAASIKETVVCTSILSPTRISSCWKGFRAPLRPRRPPPVKPLNKSSKLKSAPKPPPNPPGKPPAPPAPAKGLPPANGSPPGPGPAPPPWSKAAAPNWSHAAFFCGSVNSSYADWASVNFSFAVGSLFVSG